MENDAIIYDRPVIETPFLSKQEQARLRKKFIYSFLFNKFGRNTGYFFGLFILFIGNSSFRKRAIEMLKRYIR